MTPEFNCLYYLENDTICILEIKRTDLPENADIAERFRWLQLKIASLKVESLEFRSMDRSDNVEERFFEQGYLKFNPETGTFIEKFNSAQHKLEVKNINTFPSAYKNVICDFLSYG
jgi:hypothetical protein